MPGLFTCRYLTLSYLTLSETAGDAPLARWAIAAAITRNIRAFCLCGGRSRKTNFPVLASGFVRTDCQWPFAASSCIVSVCPATAGVTVPVSLAVWPWRTEALDSAAVTTGRTTVALMDLVGR